MFCKEEKCSNHYLLEQYHAYSTFHAAWFDTPGLQDYLTRTPAALADFSLWPTGFCFFFSPSEPLESNRMSLAAPHPQPPHHQLSCFSSHRLVFMLGSLVRSGPLVPWPLHPLPPERQNCFYIPVSLRQECIWVWVLWCSVGTGSFTPIVCVFGLTLVFLCWATADSQKHWLSPNVLKPPIFN